MTTATAVPDENDWAHEPLDDDVLWLRNLVGGKSHAEVQEHFAHGRFGERMHELLYAPRPVFQYYIQSAAIYLTSEHEDEDDSDTDVDAASAFLNFLIAREQRDPGAVAAVYPLLRPCIEYVAARQEALDAPVEIYGQFPELARQLEVACGA